MHLPMLNQENAIFDEDGMTESVEVMESNSTRRAPIACGHTVLSEAIEIGNETKATSFELCSAPRRRFRIRIGDEPRRNKYKLLRSSLEVVCK